MTSPIPMTVLGGWLGSGKTTLLNRLLAEATERVAVVVNDIGDVNIDVDLIDRRDADVIELTNGCVCCTIGGSLAVTLRDLVARSPRPQRIVIEASGVADPAKVAEYGNREVVKLAAVVVTADATDVRRLSQHRTYGQLAHDQLSSADMIVVTKVDLVTSAQATAVVAGLETDYPDAAVLPTDSAIGWATSVLTAAGHRRRPDRGGDTDEVCVHTATWVTDSPVDVDAVAATLSAAGPSILRVKGFIRSHEIPGSVLIVQVAATTVSVERDTDQTPASIDRLVVIADDAQAAADLCEALTAATLNARR